MGTTYHVLGAGRRILYDGDDRGAAIGAAKGAVGQSDAILRSYVFQGDAGHPDATITITDVLFSCDEDPEQRSPVVLNGDDLDKLMEHLTSRQRA